MLKRAKLTKRLLMKLNTGTYIMSNVFYKKDMPIYAGRVVPLPLREKQWETIVDLAVDQRICRIFANKAAGEKWLSELFSG